MRVFGTKAFTRFAAHEGIGDDELCAAVARAEAGLIDADLGGGVIKLRLARKGQGRSGGYRSLAAYRRGSRAFFAFGFAKNARDNISSRELKALRLLARKLLGLAESALATTTSNGAIQEIKCHA